MNTIYLKALEIQGFKSFADKTRLTFEKDITAIVGPNGSGKSNISDAILWVMGEQRTKALHCNKMEDVIFGGTEVRSPMGFAQVSLILDNSGHLFETEGSELMLTRRYYRSGESEYYINKEPVRLKDINGLLMDTGLGRDGYSIIGQGKIADIISTKSADRREVFEEAAGISRYRFRKEEAERKLEKTEENLVRINDKIEELGGIDTLWAGIGYKGLVAWCEAPTNPYQRVTEEMYINMKTKVVNVSYEKVVEASQRVYGGCYDMIPHQAVTIGMKSMLTSKRAVCMIPTGEWKQTVLRVLMFSDATLEYPCTLLPKYIPEVVVLTDKKTATHPLSLDEVPLSVENQT